MNVFSEKLINRFAMLAAGSVLISGAALKAQQNYNPAHIVNVMRGALSDNNYQLVVAGHRGYFYNFSGVPENSLDSVYEAYHHDIEAIEIDIKRSADGTLYLFHDYNIGRVTNYSEHGQQYDPFTNSGPNPEISSLSDGTLGSLRLKDTIRTANSAGHTTDLPPTTLEAALTEIRDAYPHMAVILDLKNANDAYTARDLVSELHMSDYVILKGNWSYVNSNNGYGIPFIVNLGAGDLDNIARSVTRNVTQQNAQSAVNTFIRDELGQGKSDLVEFEIRMRNYDTGPVAPTYNFVKSQKGISVSQPVPEVGSKFYYPNGSCCQSLGAGLAKTEFFGDETSDQREDDELMIDYYKTVFTDNPIGLRNAAQSKGRRDSTNSYF